MDVRTFTDVRTYLAEAEPFLVAREAEHNLLLGVAGTLRDRPDAYPERPYLAIVRAGHDPVLVAIQTPPWQLVLSETDDPGAVDAVLADVLTSGRALPGAMGPRDAVARFAAGWTTATGRRSAIGMRERIYRLTAVVLPPRPAIGTWRWADERDHDRLVAWLEAFRTEAVPSSPAPTDIDATVRIWTARRSRRMGLWLVDDTPVAMAGAGSPTPNGSRVGPVYTPPAARGRGYASALTAAVSQAELDDGRRFCFLFTDLANPTSNRIYQAIGYEPVADVDHWVFHA